ncbi:unnamed protein product [Allacma fusca]|uniref:Uncharacterized protein n=1 Tax=Allacma fusca TaxID=39272 RepID=A0A8J2PWH6_9HEXA|nr:unnamed protein product [Allacma fusca]
MENYCEVHFARLELKCRRDQNLSPSRMNGNGTFAKFDNNSPFNYSGKERSSGNTRVTMTVTNGPSPTPWKNKYSALTVESTYLFIRLNLQCDKEVTKIWKIGECHFPKFFYYLEQPDVITNMDIT